MWKVLLNGRQLVLKTRHRADGCSIRRAMRQSALELARKQVSAHNVERGRGVGLVTGVNRQAGQEIGEQHSSVPSMHRSRKGLRMSASTVTSGVSVLALGIEVSPVATPAHSPHGGETGRRVKGLGQGRALCAAKRS